MMASNESLNKKVTCKQLMFLNSELVPIKVEKRNLENQSIKFKFSMILRSKLLEAIRSDRYDITDETVMQNFRLRNSAMQRQVTFT